MVRIVGKGNQPALIPLAPRTARAIDAAAGERTDGPLLARADGSRLDRHADPRQTRRYDRARGALDRNPSYLAGATGAR